MWGVEWVVVVWPYVVAVLNLILSVVASGHAVLSKRDTRAAIGWVGVIWLAPFLGVMLYVFPAVFPRWSFRRSPGPGPRSGSPRCWRSPSCPAR